MTAIRFLVLLGWLSKLCGSRADEPRLVPWEFAPARYAVTVNGQSVNERGLIARLSNLSDQPAKTDVSFTSGISTGHRTPHIETDIETLSGTGTSTWPANFTRQQTRTYRLQLN